MREMSTLNARILAYVKRHRKQKSYQLIADHFGVSRNIIAGLVFRDRHPRDTRMNSPNGIKNKIGTGRHGPGVYPEMTAQNTR